MIDTQAFVADALRPWDYGRCNCTSSVAAAAPSCARAFALWMAQPVKTRRSQAKRRDVLEQTIRFAERAGCVESSGPDGWGVVMTGGREVVALKSAGRWLLRVWPRGVVLLPGPVVLKQWGAE